MGFIVRFVNQVSSTPTLRLDLNDGATWTTMADGTDVSPPELNLQLVSTLLTDGVRVPAAAYGHRVIQLRLMLRAASADAAATAFQALARELDRPTNVLQWQPEGASSPVFFNTFRSDPGRIGEFLDWTQKTIDLSIVAEPFALGTKITNAPVVVSNDPAQSNGTYFDVAGVQGDIETPVAFSIAGTELPVSGAIMQTALGVRRRGTPSAMMHYVQAEAGTRDGISSLPGNDATMSGAGSNYVRITPTTSTMDRAILWSPLGNPGVDLRGTYRVWARTRRSVSTGQLYLQLKWGYTSGNMVENARVALALSTQRLMVDLGLVQWPMGFDPISDAGGAEYSVDGIDLALYMERPSGGTSTLDVDYLVFVPADDRLAIVAWPKYRSVINTVVADGAEASIIGLTTGGALTSTTFPYMVGSIPMLAPGVTNRIVWVKQVSPFDANTLADTTTVTVSYFPRYLYVRPATS